MENELYFIIVLAFVATQKGLWQIKYQQRQPQQQWKAVPPQCNSIQVTATITSSGREEGRGAHSLTTRTYDLISLLVMEDKGQYALCLLLFLYVGSIHTAQCVIVFVVIVMDGWTDGCYTIANNILPNFGRLCLLFFPFYFSLSTILIILTFINKFSCYLYTIRREKQTRTEREREKLWRKVDSLAKSNTSNQEPQIHSLFEWQ